MSLDKIISTILDEAKAAEKAALDEARIMCDQIIKEAKEKAAGQAEAVVKKAYEEKEKTVLRRRSVSSIDSRKVILEKKQQVIKECFDEAAEKIAELPKDEYIDYLVRLGISSDMGGGFLTFNEKERGSVGPEVVRRLNEAAAKNAAENGAGAREVVEYELGEASDSVKSGFWIRNGQTYADNTVGTQVDFVRAKMAAEVSDMLFEEE